MRWRTSLLLAVGIVLVVAALISDPIAQDPAYHVFADRRTLLGIPNFMNVVSNAAFVIVGILGIAVVTQADRRLFSDLRIVWLVLYLGIVATALGSAFYHWNPSNFSLAVDRLGMVIGFMALVALVIGEYGSRKTARMLLLPLLLLGVASVLYWLHTESLGRGDLRLYALVQFVPILLIPLTLILFPDRSDLTRWFWWLILLYVLSKVAEHFDTQIYAFGHIMSGHSLKHLLAALAPASLIVGLTRRMS